MSRYFKLNPLVCSFAIVMLILVCVGCSSGSPANQQETTGSEPVIPVFDSGEAGIAATPLLTVEEMRKRLGANENAQFERAGTRFVAASLAGSGAKSLDALAGQPLKMLDITQTSIQDLSPLKGMPLEKLAMVDCPVADLAPLAGLPLVLLDASQTLVSDVTPVASLHRLSELYLEKAKVSDVSPLRGLHLNKLWLNSCPVTDLGPLAGHEFEELNLCNTQVAQLDQVATMKLGTLWLRETPIHDLAPLHGLSLVSLDIQGAPVADLSPLAEMTSLQRLNIAKTDVTDLSPLAGLQLTRLILSPERITQGLEVIRKMPSLRELDTSFEGGAAALTPSEFWERYDRGDFKPQVGK